MFDWLIRLLGGFPAEEYWVTFDGTMKYQMALQDIAALDTPNAAHGVKRAVKIAKDALGLENENG